MLKSHSPRNITSNRIKAVFLVLSKLSSFYKIAYTKEVSVLINFTVYIILQHFVQYVKGKN